MSLFSYKIPGWDKYNPRKERVSHSWFRFQKDFFTGQDGFLMTPEQKLLYILLCCERCGRNSDLVSVRTEYVSALVRLSEQSVINNLTHLHELGLIALEGETPRLSPPVHQLAPVGPLRTNERTNERQVTNCDQLELVSLPHKQPLDVEAVYQEYPRKEGKTLGMKKLKKEIKTQEDLDLLKQAITNYKSQILEARTEKRYIKQFSTFMGCWRDYLDEAQPEKLSYYAQQQLQEAARGPRP